MTVRALILGLLLAVGVACYGATCDLWSEYSGIGGDLVPNYVFGLVLLGLLVVNPLLRWLRLSSFKSAEWMVILSMGLMGAVVAGSAILWTFPHPIITPIADHRSNPDWQAKDLLGYVPGVMLVDPHKPRPTPHNPHPDVVKDYLRGLSSRQRRIGIGEVPWRNWAPTLAFWFTLLGLTFTAGACAVVVVHRQWSRREHLAYPIATFTNELIGSGDRAAAFRRRIFWTGFGVSFVILNLNGLHTWFPSFPAVTTSIDMTPLRELEAIKPLVKVPLYGKSVLRMNFYFAAVGLAYFLSSEVSFSLGVSGWLYVLCVAPLVARGVDMSRSTFQGGLPIYMYFGAYLGMGIMVVYLGRRYYWAVLKRSVLPGGRDPTVLDREVWAARIGIAACVLMVGLLWKIGLHPALGAAFVLLVGLLFLMVGRVNAATGLFIVQAIWHPVDVLVGLLGALAIGPHALIILAVLCVVVTIDSRIAAVPLVLNALRLRDLQKVTSGYLAWWMTVALVVALIVGVCLVVFVIYSHGATSMETATVRWAMVVGRMPFNMLSRTIDRLTETQLDEASKPLTLARLVQARPARHFLVAVGIGLLLVVACSYLRLRFARWPLHPVVFLLWGTPWMVEYAPCFLLAWVIKGIVLKYGGQNTYRRSRTFFVGLVAGEITVALLWAVVNAVYFGSTGLAGEAVHVRP